jgi:glutamate-5-semialdehyde dehydrogenase
VILPQEMETALEALKSSALKLRQLSTEKKNEVLLTLAKNLLTQSSLILSENSKDLAKLSAESSQAFRDRLTLTPSRISSLVEGLKQVALQPDPVHELVEKRTLPNGLQLKKIRAPLGILFMIFE